MLTPCRMSKAAVLGACAQQMAVLQIVAQNQGQTDLETRHQFSRMLLGMADMPAVLVHLADRLQVRPDMSVPHDHQSAAIQPHISSHHMLHACPPQVELGPNAPNAIGKPAGS